MFRLAIRTSFPLVLALAAIDPAKAARPVQSRVEAIRFWSFGDVTRIAIQTQGEYKLAKDQIDNPSRVYFDLAGIRPPSSAHRGVQTIHVRDKRLRQIRIAEVSPGRTRVVFDLTGPVEVVSSQLVNPDRLMIEFRPKPAPVVPSLMASRSSRGSASVSAPATSPAPLVGPPTAAQAAALHWGRNTPDSASARSALASTLPVPTGNPSAVSGQLTPPGSRTKTVQTSDGLVVQNTSTAAKPELVAASSGETPSKTLTPSKIVGIASPAKRKSTGESSLVRVFGLKLGKVVIDAGHGGHDTGTVGPDGLMEKDLVLDVALRLGKLVTGQLGAEVVYTRPDDTFVPLEERTKIANHEKADLFISVHANSSPEPSATGVETYFFNFNSDRHGLDLATRENATATSSISDLNDLLHKALLNAKLEESREFAQRIQTALSASSVKMNSHSRDRGVRQAPFVVLIGATMPSILAEIGFVSNPHDEKLLERPEQRQTIADALFRGISQYAKSLSHVQVADAGPE